VRVKESVPFSIEAPGVRVTVAVVEVSVTSGVTAQPTAGSEVLQVISPGTKFVPVTPMTSEVVAAVRFPTVVTAETVGPATIAIVPV
jgi:hypothetical protein